LADVRVSSRCRVELQARNAIPRTALRVDVGGKLRGAQGACREPCSTFVAARGARNELDDAAERSGPELGSENTSAHDQPIEKCGGQRGEIDRAATRAAERDPVEQDEGLVRGRAPHGKRR
jgi:hypothetical protein